MLIVVCNAPALQAVPVRFLILSMFGERFFEVAFRLTQHKVVYYADLRSLLCGVLQMPARP